ncbi:hypothetical protein D9M72_628420 [compost metagenome]
MNATPFDELPEMQAELVVGVGRNVVELIDGDQPVVELLHAIRIDCEAERRVCADQHFVGALKESAD